MKMTKLIYPLVLTLAVALATTGCHNHKPGKVTTIPGHPPGQMGDNPQNTLPPGNAIPQDTGIDAKNGGGPLPENWTVDMMNPDRAALAAYTIHFAFDSTAIKSSEKSNLESVAGALKGDANAKLLIEGNCDERGTEEYNRSLGERRALAARERIVQAGIDPSRVDIITYGKDKPADPGHDESAWTKNRRDDFVLLHPKP